MDSIRECVVYEDTNRSVIVAQLALDAIASLSDIPVSRHGGRLKRFDRCRFFSQTGSMGNTFGHLFRITTWGESHGGGVGVVVDGCPPRLALSESDIQPDLDRRRPGQSKIVSPRKEPDRVHILSGTFEGKTLGTPICLWVMNE